MANTHNYGEIDHKIHKIVKNLKFNTKIKPINIIEEVEKLKNAKYDYSPKFVYTDNTELVYETRKNLDEIKIPETKIGNIFKDKANEIKLQLNCLEFIGTSDFTFHYQKLIPATSESETLKASLYAKNSAKDIYRQGRLIKEKDAINQIQNALDHYKLKYQIKVIPEKIGRMSITNNQLIKLNIQEKIHQNNLDKLIAHEIETHALTYENAKKQSYKIFHYGFANYILLQEGLAVYNQEKKLGIEHHEYASKNLLANKIILENSFKNAYQILSDLNWFINPANLVLKSKYGLDDTSKKGGNTKEMIYFRGASKVKDIIEKNPDILQTLYLGKINFQSIETLDNAKFINKKIQLPEFLINKEESPKE